MSSGGDINDDNNDDNANHCERRVELRFAATTIEPGGSPVSYEACILNTRERVLGLRGEAPRADVFRVTIALDRHSEHGFYRP